MTPRTVIATPDAPSPYPVFSQGTTAGGVVQVSGQLGIDPTTGALAEGIAAQTRHALAHVRAILAAGGADLDDVVMVRAYLASREDFAAFNEVYGAFFAEHSDVPPPARTTIVVTLPVEGMLVELDAQAVLVG